VAAQQRKLHTRTHLHTHLQTHTSTHTHLPPHTHAAQAVGWEYAVVIDAGSTGSRVHVYRFYRHKEFPYASVELPDEVHKTTPGLSSYSFDPRTAANSLQPLLKFAKEEVPEDQRARTPLLLLATAGLRMLPDDAANRILEETRRALAGSGFLFRDGWARVISGQHEGLYGWVSVNYATGALQVRWCLCVVVGLVGLGGGVCV